MPTQTISPALAKRIDKIRARNLPEKAKKNMITNLLLRSDPRFESGGAMYQGKKFGYYCIFDGVRYEGGTLQEIYKSIPCLQG